MPITQADVLKQGWIEKLTGPAQEQQKTWVVLAQQCLYSFKAEGKMDQPLSCLSLRECSTARPATDAESMGREGAFHIESSGQVVTFAAESKAEADAWLKLIEEKIVECPFQLLVTSPNGQHECSGTYELVMDEKPNGHALWQKHCGKFWIYSGTDGQWTIGGEVAKSKNFECASGHIHHGPTHLGSWPHKTMGAWKFYDDATKAWVEDPAIVVSAEPVPAVLDVATPRGQRTCAGTYDVLVGEKANGHAIWKKRDGPRWLFLGSNGQWTIGGAKAREKDFQVASGFIFNEPSHVGHWPDKAEGNWKYWDDGTKSWKVDAGIRVLKGINYSFGHHCEELEERIFEGKGFVLLLSTQEKVELRARFEAPEAHHELHRTRSCPASIRGLFRRKKPAFNRRASIGLALGADAPPGEAAPGEAAPAAAVAPAAVPAAAAGSAGPCEPYEAYLERASARLTKKGIKKDDPKDLFEAFRTAEDIGTIYACFARLFWMATTEEEQGGKQKVKGFCGSPLPAWTTDVPARPPNVPWHFPYEPISKLTGLTFKATSFFKLLDTRAHLPEYVQAPMAHGRLEGKTALVVGAGPCGIRAALELRLMGMHVVVVEQRQAFTRINQLHLWSWVAKDMKELGGKCLEPPPNDFDVDSSLIHAGIGDVQKFYMKIALLFGVQVLFGAKYEGTEWNAETKSWRARLSYRVVTAAEGRAGPAGAADAGPLDTSNLPSPKGPEFIDDIGALMGASGFGCEVGTPFGIKALETDGLRKEAAIGLIVNFARQNGANEKPLKSFNAAKHFFAAKFAEAKKDSGADLENVLYTKAHSTHYWVMTPTHKSMKDCGVFKDPNADPLLQMSNIDQAALDKMVRAIASVKWIGDKPAVLPAIQKDYPGDGPTPYADSGPRLFDFSKMRRSAEGCVFAKPPGQVEASNDDLYVAHVGDALMEPFWPEGLGIIRGYFGVFDACYALEYWALESSIEKAQNDASAIFGDAFAQMKNINGQSAQKGGQVLRADDERSMKAWALDPVTRYKRYTKHALVA